jgi:hypothetical protein
MGRQVWILIFYRKYIKFPSFIARRMAVKQNIIITLGKEKSRKNPGKEISILTKKEVKENTRVKIY